MIAAPLKHLHQLVQLRGQAPDFRDQMIAAPLKRAHSGSQSSSQAAFPRSDDRGHIEACRHAFSFECGLHFRDQMIAAPLKPAAWNPPAQQKLAFPRSDDRGPIEARSPRGPAKCKCSDFRDQMIAAPLKPDDSYRTRAQISHFRDQMIAAPLKLLHFGVDDLDAWLISAIR